MQLKSLYKYALETSGTVMDLVVCSKRYEHNLKQYEEGIFNADPK